MAAIVATAPAGLAQRDLGPRRAVALAVAALAVLTALDLVTDGRLGIVFSVGFVLVVATIPLAVEARSLLPAGVVPPVLLTVFVGAAVLLSPGAVPVEGLPPDTGWLGRTLAGTIERGVTLLVGHGLALTGIVVRILTDPTHPRRARARRLAT